MDVGLLCQSHIDQINCCPGIRWQRRDQDLREKGLRDMEMCGTCRAGGFFCTSPAPYLHLLMALLFLSAGDVVPPLLSQAGYPLALVRPEKRFFWSRELYKSRQEVFQSERERSC